MSVELSPTYSRSYALVVGIDAYTDPRFAPLGEAEADAGRFADLLESPPYNFHVKRLLGRDATRSAILNALYDLRGTDPDDRVVVYFACHGYTTVDRNGHETGYLAAVDTLPDRDFTAIELETVLDLRRHAGAKHIGFIFDACFSGAALGLTRSPAAAAGAFLTRRAYQVISAGAGDQTVSDFNSMTDLLVEQLDPAAADTSDLLTLSEVGLAVQRAMAYDSKQMQIPQFGHVRGSQGGEFVFFMESAAAAENAPEPPSSEYEPSTTPPEAVTRRETQPPPPAFIAGGVFGALVLLMLALVIIFGPESYSAGEQTATALAAGTGVATQEPGTVEPTGTAEPTAPPNDIPSTPGPQPLDATNIGYLARA
ncbi:MAG: caspase domain-containing protein, partial [Anaerolineae bacterium]